MSEWWTYRPEDFLLFSERVYWRLIELHNLALWPWHIFVLLAGGLVIYLLIRPGEWTDRLIFALLAFFWGVVAWTFFLQRYATINWAAIYIAGAFMVQAAMLVLLGVVTKHIPLNTDKTGLFYLGLGMVVYAIVVHPLSAFMIGRFPQSAEVFGISPDPLVIATLGILVMARLRPWCWVLWWIPILWCLLSWLTLYTLKSPTCWIPLGAVLVALGAKLIGRSR